MTLPPVPFDIMPPRGNPELKEHDACALAAFATRDGAPTRELVERALKRAADDGPPLRERGRRGRRERHQVDLPRPLWRARLGRPPAGTRGSSTTTASSSRTSSSKERRGRGPGAPAARGAHGGGRLRGAPELRRGPPTTARSARAPRRPPPVFWQLAAVAAEGGYAASQACYRTMVAIERELGCHVASFSANDCVYKVLGAARAPPPLLRRPGRFRLRRVPAHRPQPLLDEHVPDLQPGAALLGLGHNGEINTIAQLREQCQQLGLPITRDGSDTQDLNRLLEGLIFEKGLSLLEAVEFALPPILGEVHRLPAHLQDLYVHYREAWGPYAQGPVALACRGLNEMVFAVDALGLRPLWWIETDELYVVSSQPGIVPVAELDARPLPLAPGEKVAVITGEDGVPSVLDYWEVQREVHRARQAARRAPPRRGPRPPGRRARPGGRGPPEPDEEAEPDLPLDTLLASAGWIEHDKQQVQFHADRGAEPIGSLGWDGPLGALSLVPIPLSDYLQETVAVVTNPAIDREREVEHFSTRVVLGPPAAHRGRRSPTRRSAATCGCRSCSAACAGRRGSACPSSGASPWATGSPAWRTSMAAWGWRAVRLPLAYPTDLRRPRAHRPPRRGRDRRGATRARSSSCSRTSRRTGVQRVCDPHLAVAAVDKALREAPRRRGRPVASAGVCQPDPPGGGDPQRARRDGRPRLRAPRPSVPTRCSSSRPPTPRSPAPPLRGSSRGSRRASRRSSRRSASTSSAATAAWSPPSG